MKRQPGRLSLKKETLAPLAGGHPSFIGVVNPANTHQDCTSPFCGPTTCPASCDCQTVGVAQEDQLARH
jgi:hypothetical protein